MKTVQVVVAPRMPIAVRLTIEVPDDWGPGDGIETIIGADLIGSVSISDVMESMDEDDLMAMDDDIAQMMQRHRDGEE